MMVDDETDIRFYHLISYHNICLTIYHHLIKDNPTGEAGEYYTSSVISTMINQNEIFKFDDGR